MIRLEGPVLIWVTDFKIRSCAILGHSTRGLVGPASVEAPDPVKLMERITRGLLSKKKKSRISRHRRIETKKGGVRKYAERAMLKSYSIKSLKKRVISSQSLVTSCDLEDY